MSLSEQGSRIAYRTRITGGYRIRRRRTVSIKLYVSTIEFDTKQTNDIMRIRHSSEIHIKCYSTEHIRKTLRSTRIQQNQYETYAYAFRQRANVSRKRR
jgi:hypothetical protein